MGNLLRQVLLASLLSSFCVGQLNQPNGGPQGAGSILMPSPQTVQDLKQGILVFRSQAYYVTVPVLVQDNHGKPVHGLTKDQFTIFENGREQPVASFEEFVAKDIPLRKSAPRQISPGLWQASNDVENRGHRPITVIAVDLVNIPLLDQPSARKALLDILENHIPGGALVQVVVITDKGLVVVNDFTDDSRILTDAAKQLRTTSSELEVVRDNRASLVDLSNSLLSSGGDAGSIARTLAAFEESTRQQNESLRRRSLSTTLYALDAIAKSLAGVPSRKTLIWITGSFALSDLEMMSYASYARTMGTLAAANVAVYPVDARGLQGIGLSAPGPMQMTATQRGITANGSIDPAQTNDYLTSLNVEHWDTINTLLIAAATTGGIATFNTNDLTTGVERAMEDGNNYYLLTYKLNSEDRKEGWRKIKVKVAQPDVKVRSRQGIYLTQFMLDPTLTRKQDVQTALLSPLELTGLPLTVEWSTKPHPQFTNQKKLAFELILPPGAVMPGDDGKLECEFSVLARDAAGKETGSKIQTYKAKVSDKGRAQLLEDGITYRGEVVLPTGEHQVRFMVHDSLTGKTGTVAVRITI